MSRRRRDFVHSQAAPKPNSFVPAVCAAVFDDEGRIVLQKRRDNGRWALPGGQIELTESVEDAATREVLEETGLVVQVADLLGVYSDPEYIISYGDGEVRRQFALLVRCSIRDGSLRTSEESSDIGFFTREAALELDLSPGQDIRIQDSFSRTIGGCVR